MPTWIVFYNDGKERTIEADSVSVAGTIVAFLKHSNISTPDGKIAGVPIAFVDLSNPNVRHTEMVNRDVQEGAKVVSIV